VLSAIQTEQKTKVFVQQALQKSVMSSSLNSLKWLSSISSLDTMAN